MVSTVNFTKQTLPDLPYEQIATKILGRRYDLSIAFIGSQRSRTLNRTYRNKDKSTDVLAFPVSDNLGQIFIDLDTTRKKARLFEHTFRFHVGFLLIHACLHLKGYVHGSKMESEETRLIKALNLQLTNTNESTHRHRSGYRNRHHPSGSLRIQKRK